MAGKRKGNKVFTETEGTTSGNKKTSRNVLPEGVMPGAPISNVMRDDFGLDIPYETVPCDTVTYCCDSAAHNSVAYHSAAHHSGLW